MWRHGRRCDGRSQVAERAMVRCVEGRQREQMWRQEGMRRVDIYRDGVLSSEIHCCGGRTEEIIEGRVIDQSQLLLALTLRGPSGGHCVGLSG